MSAMKCSGIGSLTRYAHRHDEPREREDTSRGQLERASPAHELLVNGQVNDHSPCQHFQRCEISAPVERVPSCDGIEEMVVAAIASATLPTFLGWRVFARRVERDFPMLRVQSSDTAPRHNSQHRSHLAVLTLSVHCVILSNRVFLFAVHLRQLPSSVDSSTHYYAST
jgi:hypothetical protein